MKRIITSIAYLFISTISFAQLNAAFEKDTISFERDKQTDKIFHLVVNISNINAAGIAANTITFAINPSPASTMAIIDYQLNVAPINVYMGIRQIDCPIIIFHGENNGGNVMYISIQMSYNNPLVQTKTIVLKISNCKEKKADADDHTKEVKKGLIKDTSNYLKVEIVQYSDITGIKNDLPNGLLQYQGLLKIPLNIYKHTINKNSSWQSFRSLIIDATLNRVDKSKEEIDYKYTTFLYQDNLAKKTPNPWLATTDIWRYSNFQAGFRIVPIAYQEGNFRIQLQAGVRLLKNLPFSQDTIRSGQDSGKVKTDFRSVYSNVRYIELYVKTLTSENKVDISLNTGLMWLTLMDSYYKQIEIHQQDPFQKTIALSTVSGSSKNSPMWFTSFRLGYLIGEEKIVSTFFRLNYMLQKGTYLSPLSNIIDGRQVIFEEKKFYNNFFQIHIGITIELSKLFESKEKKKTQKDDGPVSNSIQ